MLFIKNNSAKTLILIRFKNSKKENTATSVLAFLLFLKRIRISVFAELFFINSVTPFKV
ncbi:MAG: hypothetical protein Rsou_1867 [Candidatus Ruthia sp. Asou_11_S2]|nr:hypothetical protein [Candidatus Ruthia sp. Asou_11_S2]